MTGIVIGTVMLLMTACAPPVSTAGFDGPDPAAKMYAIEAAVQANDRSKVPRIIEELDSDDPAVRLLAIEALQRLTGERFGYRVEDPPHVRAKSIRLWEEAEKSGRLSGGRGTEPGSGQADG